VGWHAEGRCWPTREKAAEVSCLAAGGVYPAADGTQGATYAWCGGVYGPFFNVQYMQVVGGASSSFDVTYPASEVECDPGDWSSPFDLPADAGLALGGAIVAVWASAWAFRALVRVVRSDGEALE